jgi:excisionase family DNA binding protein
VDATQSDDDGGAQFYDEVPKQFLYTRRQAAAAFAMSLARLDELIHDRQITAVKDGRRVKFTPADLQAYVDSLPRMGGPPGEPDLYLGGLSRRSWLHHQRYPEGNHHHRRPRQATEVVAPAKVQPLPTSFRPARAEPPEIIAGMPDLTETQLELLNQLRKDGEVIVTGEKRKTVEALVKRGLATYSGEYVLNEVHRYYFYRFTVRLAEPS